MFTIQIVEGSKDRYNLGLSWQQLHLRIGPFPK